MDTLSSAETAAATKVATKKVLFLAQLPPPIHGANVVSQRVHDLMTARGDMAITQAWSGGARSLEDVGQKSVGKLIDFARLMAMLAWQVVTGVRYDIAYLTLAPWSHAALRDGLLIAMAKLLSRRTLVHLHAEGLDQVIAGTSWPRRLLRRLIGGVELIAITEKVAVAVRQTNHFAAVHVLPNCAGDPGAPRLAPSSELRCGYLANLDPRKGTLRFLDCVEAFVRAGLPVTARMAGPSTAELTIPALEAEVERRGLAGTVQVVGPLYGDNKIEFFSNLDLFIYLSRRDYFPLVVIEALSCGAIPIVYDNEGEAELVGPPFAENVVAPDLAPETMRAAVTAIARRYNDDRDSLARARATARQRFLDCFTEDKFRARLNAILDA